MISRRALNLLLTVAAILTVAIAVDLAVARLLAAMQDPAAASVLDRIALGLGILWLVDLVCLVLALAIRAIESPRD